MSAAASTTILTALTRLMTAWSSPRVQAQFARDAGIRIEPGDIAALYTLGLQGDCRAATLADRLRLSRPTMSKQLQRLEASHLIVREADPADGRASIVTLSTTGQSAYDALVVRGLAAVDSAVRTWSPDERNAFAGLAQRFVDSIGIEDPARDAGTTSGPHGRSTTEE